MITLGRVAPVWRVSDGQREDGRGGRRRRRRRRGHFATARRHGGRADRSKGALLAHADAAVAVRYVELVRLALARASMLISCSVKPLEL